MSFRLWHCVSWLEGPIVDAQNDRVRARGPQKGLPSLVAIVVMIMIIDMVKILGLIPILPQAGAMTEQNHVTLCPYIPQM